MSPIDIIFIMFVISIVLITAFIALGYAIVYLHKRCWLGVLLGMFIFLTNFSIGTYGFYYSFILLNLIVR